MSRGRRRTVKGLVVLGSVLAFLSVFAIWIERQALNTDDWVSTSDRLIQNPTIRTAVGDYLVDQLYENVNVEKELKDILPGDTKELAGPGRRRPAPGGRRRRRKGAGNLDRADALGGRQPLRPRTADLRAGRQGRSGLDRGRRTSASTSAACSPTSPARSESARTWPKSCRPTRARSRSSAPTN